MGELNIFLNAESVRKKEAAVWKRELKEERFTFYVCTVIIKIKS